jgi:hypothetical protein
MDNQLIKTECFVFGTKKQQVRVFNTPKGVVIPLVDIAHALGHDRTGLTQIINSSKELFEGMKESVIDITPGGRQELVCLNRDGVTGLLMKLNYTRIKKEETKQKVLAYARRFKKENDFILARSCKVTKIIS